MAGADRRWLAIGDTGRQRQHDPSYNLNARPSCSATPCVDTVRRMPMVLYALAAFCALFAATQLVATAADLRIGLACIAAAILVGSGAVAAAIDRCRPKPVSKNNGGGMAGPE